MIQKNTAVHKSFTVWLPLYPCTDYSQYYFQVYILHAQQRIVSIPVTICNQSFLACIIMMCPVNHLQFSYYTWTLYHLLHIMLASKTIPKFFVIYILFTTWLTKFANVYQVQYLSSSNTFFLLKTNSFFILNIHMSLKNIQFMDT